MQKTILILSFIFSVSLVTAQSYFTAAGIRGGDGIGVSVQQRVAKRLTIETILKNNSARDEFQVTAILQRHVPLIFRHLNFYTGAGLHKGFTNNVKEGVEIKDPFGLTVIGGLELSLNRFNISYDFKPAINLTGGEKTFYPETAISLRYVLVKDKFLKDMQKKRKKKKKQKARAKRKENRQGIFKGGFFGN